MVKILFSIQRHGRIHVLDRALFEILRLGFQVLFIQLSICNLHRLFDYFNCKNEIQTILYDLIAFCHFSHRLPVFAYRTPKRFSVLPHKS